jgi:hypothetical protein
VLSGNLADLANTRRDNDGSNESEQSIDAIFTSANGFGSGDGSTKQVQGHYYRRLDRYGRSRVVRTHIANHYEVTLVQFSVNCCTIEAKPENLGEYRVWDSV